MAANHQDHLFLVTGGHGFIGSHVARHLHGEGYRVRIVDIVEESPFSEKICDDLIVGNLCDLDICSQAAHGVHTVLHFAATMGGMGTIHSANDFTIYADNHSMTLNILSAAVSAGVERFFYASSACVYPETLQESVNGAVSLRESDVWAHPPPKPQGLYGLEKLSSEQLLHQYSSTLAIRIARFHNIYGPGGAWSNGREKAPAAMLRKAIIAKHIGGIPLGFEIWGNGSQKRSYLWIGDAVDAIIRLLDSQSPQAAEPVNIGSDEPISTADLANLALQAVGVDIRNVEFHHDSTKPTGVASRNSNNTRIFEMLEWKPTVTLTEGMQRTGHWIEGEINRLLDTTTPEKHTSTLHHLSCSQLVDLNTERLIFAIILPITSRGTASPNDCLTNLSSFAQSLVRTTWRDTHQLGGQRYHVKVYLAIDQDDEFILGSGNENKAQYVLKRAGIMDTETLVCNYPRGHVCSLWRHCAKQAFEDGCDYMSLMGDDVILQDEGWMRDTHTEFLALAATEGVPPGFGCVAFTDMTFPGMPTFPIVHRTHLEIYSGNIVPEIFVNQDGDPYLFQLYRHWGCSRMLRLRISNALGGNGPARYTKQHVQAWTYEILDSGVEIAQKWLRDCGYLLEKKITLDVVIPCYRVQIAFLDTILHLKPSRTCTVMFIIIVDNPDSPHIGELLHRYAHRVDVRIRVNGENLGASASRNRGIAESAASWVHFLDDDITPQSDLLIEAERAIRAHPDAAGFVGNALFPSADRIFTAAVHLAGVTYFWDIATKIADDIPWGVTANLIARRNVRDGVEYDLQFPKTGGGEDIDFCRKKRTFSMNNGGQGFFAAPNVIVTHPWWNKGARSYWRFYMWSVGDGGLIKKYPEHVYWDFAPNSAELLLLCGTLMMIGIGLRVPAFAPKEGSQCILAFKLAAAVILANILHDCYRHLWRNAERTDAIKTTVSGIRWVLAVIESSLLRLASEGGRTIGILQRGEIMLLGKRFDWFTGRGGEGPKREERMNSMQRLGLCVALVALLVSST